MTRFDVLLIRPDGNEADARALAGQGIGALIEPLLKITPVPDASGPRELADELGSLGAGDWLLITSPRTWGCWAESVAGLAPAVRAAAGRGLRVGAIGRATAATLPALPPGTVLVCRGVSAADLLAELLALAPGRRPRPVALLPSSERARPLLADGLRTAGWRVRRTAVYRTTNRRPPAGSAIHRGAFDAVLVRSPSAAEALAGLGVPIAGLPVFAVGPVTAASCRRRGWRVIELGQTAAGAVAERIGDWRAAG